MGLLYDYHELLNLGFVKGTNGYVNLKNGDCTWNNNFHSKESMYRFKGKWTDLRNSQVKVSGYNNP